MSYRKLLGFILLLLMVVPTLSVFTPVKEVAADGEGWLSGYSYRRPVTVVAGAGAGTNYPVPISTLSTIEYTEIATDGDADALNRHIRPQNAYNATAGTSGRLFVTYEGLNDNPYVVQYSYSNQTWNNPVLAGTNPLIDTDNHGCPSMIVANTGKILVFFGSHNTPTEVVMSNSAGTALNGFTAKADLPGTTTYPKPVKDSNGDIYVFCRVWIGATEYNEVFFKSTDDGENFGAAVTVIDMGNYYVYCSGTTYNPTTNRIAMAFFIADGAGAGTTYYGWYYAEYDIASGHMIAADGTDAGVILEKVEADANFIVHPGAGQLIRHVQGAEIQFVDGNPFMIVNHYYNATYIAIESEYWTGVSWSENFITTTDNSFNFGSFKVISPTHIDAYCMTAGLSAVGWGGDIEEFEYNGSSWTDVGPVLTEYEYGKQLAEAQVVLNAPSGPNLLCMESDGDDGYDHKVLAIDLSVMSGRDYTNNHCQDDFDDVRFTTSNGLTEIDYALISKVDGSGANFEVEIPQNISTQNATIYMYYGNSGASSGALGVNAFYEVYDGFTSFNSTTWTKDMKYEAGTGNLPLYSNDMVDDTTLTFADGWVSVNSWGTAHGTDYRGPVFYHTLERNYNFTTTMDIQIQGKNPGLYYLFIGYTDSATKDTRPIEMYKADGQNLAITAFLAVCVNAAAWPYNVNQGTGLYYETLTIKRLANSYTFYKNSTLLTAVSDSNPSEVLVWGLMAYQALTPTTLKISQITHRATASVEPTVIINAEENAIPSGGGASAPSFSSFVIYNMISGSQMMIGAYYHTVLVLTDSDGATDITSASMILSRSNGGVYNITWSRSTDSITTIATVGDVSVIFKDVGHTDFGNTLTVEYDIIFVPGEIYEVNADVSVSSMSATGGYLGLVSILTDYFDIIPFAFYDGGGGGGGGGGGDGGGGVVPPPVVPPPTDDGADTDGDGVIDAWDTNDDGVIDTIDTDGDGIEDTWDTNDDGIPDTFDEDGDGDVDSFDTDGDGEIDTQIEPNTVSKTPTGVTAIQNPFNPESPLIIMPSYRWTSAQKIGVPSILGILLLLAAAAVVKKYLDDHKKDVRKMTTALTSTVYTPMKKTTTTRDIKRKYRNW